MTRTAVRALVAMIGVATLAACTRTADDAKGLPPLSDVVRTGRLRALSLTEASGVTRSVGHAGVLWTFNDSGHDAELFAIDSAGKSLGIVRVSGARNRDWEAIASGPCDAGTCLYIGDVGDNDARHKSVQLWRVAEPQPSDDTTQAAIALTFTYPDHAHDVEAMWVSPDTSVWLLTKRPLRSSAQHLRPALLFRVPASAWRTTASSSTSAANRETPIVAELIDSIAFTPTRDVDTWITDAAFTLRNGAGLVAVRSYQQLLVLEADPFTGRPGREIRRCSLRVLGEHDGEAVTWLEDGRLLLLNEGPFSRLATGRCQP